MAIVFVSPGTSRRIVWQGGIFPDKMPTMFTRRCPVPDRSCFLFGPRGTGKSTWIRRVIPAAVSYDLLDSAEAIRLAADPGILARETAAIGPGGWVVIDEIQKVPALLDEVHRLIESRRLRFLLSGSSARKLRRGGTNLLAGRADVRHMYPLVSAEMGAAANFDRLIECGSLPLAVTSPDPKAFLKSYAITYLQEEIRAEALTRNLGGFARFLEIAARQNGQVTNVAGIARDAGVTRQSVQNWFEILVDTLLGSWLPAWKLKRATKQVSHPKFYLFDSGVARALSGRLPYPPLPEERGSLLETFIRNELAAYLSYSGLEYPLTFWRTPDGVEVDFLCETAGGFTAIEVKATSAWRPQYGRGGARLAAELGPRKVRCFGVYLGGREAEYPPFRVLPVADFLRLLWAGKVFN
jgi:predicted AAA+ superfamily ATPase